MEEETRQSRRRKEREAKKSPTEERIGTVGAIKRLYDLTTVVMCNVCDKRDTCVNRGNCGSYSDTPPNCPDCGEVMDKKADGTFFCTPCMLKDAKEKRMEEINDAGM